MQASIFTGDILPSFTGSAWVSFEGLKRQKAYEKTETIATGRALACLGLQADGAIATAEEMEEVDDEDADEMRSRVEELLYQVKHIDGDDSIDAIRLNYESYGVGRCQKALTYLREAIDAKRVADGNTTAKERNEMVKDKLNDEKA